MKLTKLIPIVIGAAAFVTAAPFAGAQTPDAPPPFCHRGPPDLTAMLTHMLQLTDAQKSQIEPLVTAVKPQLQAIHEKARADAGVVLKQLHTQIRPLLTAEQQKRLAAIEVLHRLDPHGTE
ncbi:MAG TPA: hypothetical protein VGF73_07995 [Chthoniobacterales bacterium]|jgi:Spy/CpxP family protein refolding chaperone